MTGVHFNTKTLSSGPFFAEIPQLDYDCLPGAKQSVIYLLSDPRDDDLRCYIGRTKHHRRFIQHWQSILLDGDSASEAKRDWIRDLQVIGRPFKITILEQCSDDSVDAREQYWIGLYEESPHHIVCNNSYDRSIWARRHGLQSHTRLEPHKPGHICYIDRLVEYYAERYFLLRHKRSYKSGVDSRPNELSRDYWRRTLGPSEFQIIEAGSSGHYTKSLLDLIPDSRLPIEYLDYVPWTWTKLGFNTSEEVRVHQYRAQENLINRRSAQK